MILLIEKIKKKKVKINYLAFIALSFSKKKIYFDTIENSLFKNKLNNDNKSLK